MLSLWLVLVENKFDKLWSSIVSLSLRKAWASRRWFKFLIKIGSHVKIQLEK
jgi:hypothetical protein